MKLIQLIIAIILLVLFIYLWQAIIAPSIYYGVTAIAPVIVAILIIWYVVFLFDEFFFKKIKIRYQITNDRCPHNIKGGITRHLCELCIKIKEAEQEEIKRKDKIHYDASSLNKNEIKRIKEIQLHDINYIRQLNSKEFEDMIADIFRELGYTVTQTPYVNDKGRDAILVKNGRTYLVECKLYGPDNSIGRRDLQIFFAAMQADKASKGFYINTGKFTSTAVEYAKENNIELIGINKLLNMIEEAFPNSKSSDPNIQVMCLECGDIVTFSINKKENKRYCKNNHLVKNVINQEESCDRCGSKMRVMYGRHGKFWGCTKYPKCKSTKPYVSKV